MVVAQDGPMGIEHREGSPDRDLRRGYDRPGALQVVIQIGKSRNKTRRFVPHIRTTPGGSDACFFLFFVFTFF
jgi:hypothetical protein